MIRPLRRAHCVAWMVLAGLVLAILVLATARRAPEPPPEALPGATGSVAP
jgi:hypothetical protein